MSVASSVFQFSVYKNQEELLKSFGTLLWKEEIVMSVIRFRTFVAVNEQNPIDFFPDYYFAGRTL